MNLPSHGTILSSFDVCLSIVLVNNFFHWNPCYHTYSHPQNKQQHLKKKPLFILSGPCSYAILFSKQTKRKRKIKHNIFSFMYLCHIISYFSRFYVLIFYILWQIGITYSYTWSIHTVLLSLYLRYLNE